MAKYSDEDIKWITVHPNGKGNAPGIHIPINGAGKVVDGPDGLKNDINASGGLKDAKSVPLSELKDGGVHSEPDFISPVDEDIGDIFEDDDGAPDFTPPADDDIGDVFGDDDENSGKIDNAEVDPIKQFVEKNIDGWTNGYVASLERKDGIKYEYDDVKSALKEFIDDNPGSIGKIINSDGNVKDYYLDIFPYDFSNKMKDFIAKKNQNVQNNSPSKFTDKQILKYANIQADGNTALADAWVEYIKSHQDEFVDNGFGGIAMFSTSNKFEQIKSEIENSVGGNIPIYGTKYCITEKDIDEHLRHINKTDPVGIQNYKKTLSYIIQHPDTLLALSPLMEESDPLYQKVMKALGHDAKSIQPNASSPANVITSVGTGAKFTDDDITKAVSNIMLAIGSLHPDVTASFVESNLRNMLTGKFYISLGGVKQGCFSLGYDHPITKEMIAIYNKANPRDVFNIPAENQQFTHENFEKFAKKFMKANGLKGKNKKNLILQYLIAHPDNVNVDLNSGDVVFASQDAENALKQHLGVGLAPTNVSSPTPTPPPPTPTPPPPTPTPPPPTPTPPPPTPTPPPVNTSTFSGDTTGGYKFPATMNEVNGLTFVKKLGGASGAEASLYTDSEGNQYVMKRYKPTDKVGQARLREECEADAYYLAGGATVPNFKLYGDENSGYVKLSRYIPDTKTLGSVWSSATPEMQEKIKANLRKSFALDVMAGAWDVLGQDRDNILVDKDGNIWRCDNGGAFNRRAVGGEKTEAQWGDGHIDDLWTMRGMAPGLDGKKVPDATGKADFFGDISTHQLLSDIVTRDWDKIIAHLPKETQDVMRMRIAHAKEYHAVCDNVVTAGMYGDGQHSEDITLNYHCLNKFGLKSGCTNKGVKPGNWGWLRGHGSGNPPPKLTDFVSTPKPKLSDFLTIPEPVLSDYTQSLDVNAPEKILAVAAKTINFHTGPTDKNGNPNPKIDGHPNTTAVDDAIALKPKLEVVASGTDANAKKAQEMLSYIKTIEGLKVKAAANHGVWPTLTSNLGPSPVGPVDTNTPDAQAKAQQAYQDAHDKWQQTVANAQASFTQATADWNKMHADGVNKFNAAMTAWKSGAGKSAFAYSNVTEAFEEFCKQNGIDSSLFWDMAGSQGGSSQGKGSCRMKVLEILAMGGNLDDPFGSVQGISSHSSTVKDCANAFKADPKLLQKYMRAYTAMKSLTQMILHNSSFVGNFTDRGVVRMCRTESKHDVIDAYGLKKGVVQNYNIGAHESFGVFHTTTPFNYEAVFCDIPYSRISSLYFLNRPNGGSMYLGDSENEAGVNAVGLPKVYWKHVNSGIPLTDAYDFVDNAFGTKSPKVV